MKSSELFVKCLEAEGVDYIFGLPGEENIDLLNALSTSNIKFILTHDERYAALMASAYGRLSGKAGVCLSTCGKWCNTGQGSKGTEGFCIENKGSSDNNIYGHRRFPCRS